MHQLVMSASNVKREEREVQQVHEETCKLHMAHPLTNQPYISAKEPGISKKDEKGEAKEAATAAANAAIVAAGKGGKGECSKDQNATCGSDMDAQAEDKDDSAQAANSAIAAAGKSKDGWGKGDKGGKGKDADCGFDMDAEDMAILRSRRRRSIAAATPGSQVPRQYRTKRG